MLIEESLKQLIKEARKSHDVISTNVLTVALGQIQLDASNKETTEEQRVNVIRKLIKSNETTTESMQQKPASEWSSEWQESAPKLAQEITILKTLLPKTLTEEETKAALFTSILEIKAAKSDGQALGTAIKYFKSNSTPVDNNVVKKVVGELRTTIIKYGEENDS